MAKFSNCLQIVNNMPERDQEALLARLDELQAQGMNAKEAQLQAAIDVLAQVQAEAPIKASADRYITQKEIGEMERQAFARLQEDKKYKELTAKIAEAEEAGSDRFNRVVDKAVEILKSRPGFKKISEEFDAKTVRNLAQVFMDDADAAVPEATPSLRDATQARQDYVEQYLKDAGIPEPREFSDRANQDRGYYNDPAFRRWFKESKAVDANGRPLVAFHVTTKDFVEFDTDAGKTKGQKSTAAYSGQLGAWFTAPSLYSDNYEPGNAEVAVEGFIEDNDGNAKPGAVTMPVHLSVQNPMEYSDFESMLEDRDSYPSIAKFKADLVAQGYDGIVIRNSDTDGAVDRDDWVAFEPTQIKSAIGNNGEFNPTNPNILKSVDRPQFYSQLQRAIEGVPDRLSNMGAMAWKQWIDSNGPKLGVKKEEIDWSGIKDYLDLQGKAKLSKDDLARYLDESGVKISEVISDDGKAARLLETREKADAAMDKANVALMDATPEIRQLDFMNLRNWAEDAHEGSEYAKQKIAELNLTDEQMKAVEQYGRATSLYNKAYMASAKAEERKTRYGKYTLPGGENYRELLITLPTKEPRELNDIAQSMYGKTFSELDDDEANSVTRAERKEKQASNYRSSHWLESNVLAHIRINDRTDANGKRVLFVEEVQSDWGQEGKKKGFQLSDAQIKANAEKELELRKRVMELRKQGFKTPDDGTPESEIDPKFLEIQSLLAQQEELRKQGSFYRGLPPSAPFVTKTEGWLNLALKRIAMMAVEGGYEKVAFVNGEQSADRYDLSKSIESIGYDPKTQTLEAYDKNRNQVMRQSGVSKDELEDHIGKEVASRLLDQTPVMGKHLLEGQDIKVGGKGMVKFYDEIVPQALNKLLPKLGGEKMGTVNVNAPDRRPMGGGAMMLLDEDKRLDQPGFDVTDKMRETVGQGVALFSPDRFVEAEESELYKKRTSKDVGLVSDEAAMAALKTDATSVRIMDKSYQVEPGELVGARLNLNVLKNTKVPVMTLHKATNAEGYKNNRGFYRGEAVQYQPAVTLRNAYFNVDQTGRENIATGTQNKFPMASVDGEYVDAKPNFDGVEVSFNPMRVHLFVDANGHPVRSAEEISMFGTRAYARGKIEYYTKDTAPNRKGEAPSEVKLSADRPWFDDLAKLKVSTNYQLGDLLKTSKKLSWWDRTVGTQYNLAQKHPQFKRVFDAVQRFIGDVSAYATRAADLAPNFLPKLESWKDIAKTPLSADDVKALRDPIFGGTLKYTRDEDGNIIETEDVSTAGVVFKDEELRQMFGLDDRQIGLYREFRRATNKSLSDLAVSDMLRYLGTDGEGVRQRALDAGNLDGALDAMVAHLDQLIEQNPKRAEVLENTKKAIKEKAGQAIGLMARGYAPLSRFGQYTVDAVSNDGERLYFSMFENDRDAQAMAREMKDQYPEATVRTGTMSQESYKLFSGVTPETLALFGESLGLEESSDDAKSQIFQEYLKAAKTNRSAMKRLIQRKGIDGFSEDAGRVLAGFVYSNARQISTNLHAGEIGRSAAAVTDGDVKDAAIRLMEYVQNPREEAQALRGLMFTQFIGGSIASAMVNLTQPFTMTLPYLAQFAGAAGSARLMADAVKLASRGIRNDDDLKAALQRGEDLGIVSPQEVHQLMAQSQGKGALQSGDGTPAGDAAAKVNNSLAKLGLGWGKVFSAAEQFNRRVTFIAAYKLARDKGMADPMSFAKQAIAETQGIYNKGNKPTWARGAVGGTLFTFKQYSIGYVEFLRRMWGNGPEGKKAVGLALGVLFLMSGLGGMPGADDLDDVIDGFLQRVLGRSFDTKQAKKEFFASILGQSGAEFVMSGISGIPGMPIDVANRMGLGNLIPGTGLLTKKRDYARDYLEIAGPAGTLFTNAGMSVAALASGDVRKAAEVLSPVAVQNALKAKDMAEMGFYRDMKGRKVIDTDGYDLVIKAIGFQPRAVAQVQEATGTQSNLITQNKLRETEIADKWAAGRIEKDPAKVEEAKQMLADWNRDNPESPIKIDASQINRRVQEANKTKAQRVAATAPKEIRSAVKKELERVD